MSLHKSLVSGARLRRERNVLTRWERILRLREGEQWDEARSVFGLPKVKVAHHKRPKKAKKEVAAEGEGVAVEGAVAAPSIGAAPVPGAKEAPVREKSGKGKLATKERPAKEKPAREKSGKAKSGKEKK